MYLSKLIKKHHLKEHLKPPQNPLTLKRQWLFLWLTTFFLVFLSACSSVKANSFNYAIQPDNIGSQFMRINIQSSHLLKTKTKDSLAVTELSDLAWDQDEKTLYAISDEGLLYHLKISIKNNKLDSIEVIAAKQLKDKNNKPLKGKFSDAEGLSLQNSNNRKKGDSLLIISFENRPRIASYSPDGKYLNNIKIIKKLQKRKSFRGNNKALESVTLHPKYGVITAAEYPLKENKLNQQTLYSSTGRKWNFAASKVKNSSITALETTPNGDVLILERAYNGLLSPIVISLRQLHLKRCESSILCETSLIAKFDSSDGWILDNFEGLTRIKENQYLMVSDNNNNPFQKTFFVLFEIVDK